MGLILPYRKIINEADYARNLLACHCMPTLMKCKSANLISVNMYRKNDGKIQRCWNKAAILKALETGVREFDADIDIMYENNDRMDLMIYDRGLLLEHLEHKDNREFLSRYGYCRKEGSVEDALRTLRLRLEEYHRYHSQGRKDYFPHEIGILLGYPREDVEAFIMNKGKNYRINGYWKVYYREEEAREVFICYHEIRQRAMELLASGKGLGEIKNITINPEKFYIY